MGAINAYQSAVKFVLKNVLKSLSISCAYDHLCVGSSFSFATYDHLCSTITPGMYQCVPPDSRRPKPFGLRIRTYPWAHGTDTFAGNVPTRLLLAEATT